MDDPARQILAGFKRRADSIAEEIAASTIAEVDGFTTINDVMLHGEIRSLARRHLDGFLKAARSPSHRPPQDDVLRAARERAVARAREMVPLAALVHSYLIAQRVISAAIVREAGVNAQSREAALGLIATGFDYNILVTTAMVDAYVEVVQGDLAELDSVRRGLVETLLTEETAAWPALARRAGGLGFDPDREYVVAVAVIHMPEEHQATIVPPRWAAQAIARASGRPERSVFIITRERDLVALLDANSRPQPLQVLDRAAKTIKQTHDAVMLAGVGTPFSGLRAFSSSYQEARRALRHTGEQRPVVLGPDDVLLFDELTSSAGDYAARLIPDSTRQALADRPMRATVEAFFAADLNVTSAAKALSLHPNTLRYRLGRIAKTTGRDPRKLVDLLELIAAARLISATTPANGEGYLPRSPAAPDSAVAR